MTGSGDQPRMFTLLLVAKPGNPADPYIGIRHILKLALRRYGLRCVEARELLPPKPERTREHENINQPPSRRRFDRQSDRQGDGGG